MPADIEPHYALNIEQACAAYGMVQLHAHIPTSIQEMSF